MKVDLAESIVQTRLKTDKSIFSKDLSPAIDSLNFAINDIPNYWQGSDYDFFEDKIKPFLKDLEELEASVDSFHQYIQGYLDAYTELINYYQTKNIDLK